jgi:hypothetical protein
MSAVDYDPFRPVVVERLMKKSEKGAGVAEMTETLKRLLFCLEQMKTERSDQWRDGGVKMCRQLSKQSLQLGKRIKTFRGQLIIEKRRSDGGERDIRRDQGGS